MTYEQILKYPVGTKYNITTQTYLVTGYWYTEHDKYLISHQNRYTDLQFMDNNLFSAHETNTFYNQVDGWLFDGDEWHCVELTWDGYQRIDDEEILKSKE